MRTKKRNPRISIAKGIAIILMVMGHALHLTPSGFEGFVNLFHMPLFFFTAGYCFNTDHYAYPSAFLRRRVKGILLPYFLWSVVFIVFMVSGIHRFAQPVYIMRTYRRHELFGVRRYFSCVQDPDLPALYGRFNGRVLVLACFVHCGGLCVHAVAPFGIQARCFRIPLSSRIRAHVVGGQSPDS